MGDKPTAKNFSSRSGLVVILIVSLLVLSWRLLIIARQPAHLIDIAKEIGSIPETDPYTRLVANPEGTRLLYSQFTETGSGMYLVETATGKSRLVLEQKEKGFGESRNWGWSPESAFLAFTVLRQPDPGNPPMSVSIYDGLSGQALTNIAAPLFTWNSQFVWLSKSSFVFSQAGGRAWSRYALNSDNHWTELKDAQAFTKGWLANLSAISPHAIAWLDKNEIHSFDFDTGAEETVWNGITNQVQSFEYNKGSENFELHCRDNFGPYSLEFRPARLGEKQGTILGVTRNVERDSYADVDKSQGVFSFTIKTQGHPKPTTFVWDGLLRHYCLAGDIFYFIGNPRDDSPGVWQYDTASKEVKCLVPGYKQKLKYAKIVAPVTLKGTNIAGREIGYHIWEPRTKRPGKKYPLLLGQSMHDWNVYPQIAANCDFYYATPNFTNWFTQVQTYSEDVPALYEILCKNPNIDTNQVYLLVFSAQGGYLNQVLNSKPGFCKGLILFHPGGFPDVSLLQSFRILILGGTDDPLVPAAAQIKRQDDAFREGIPTRLLMQQGVRHFNRSINWEKDHMVQVAKFLSEN